MQREGLKPISTGVFLSGTCNELFIGPTSVHGCNFYTRDLCNKKLVRSFGVNWVPTSVPCFWKIGEENKRIDTIDGNQLNRESQSREFKARQTTTHDNGCFLVSLSAPCLVPRKAGLYGFHQQAPLISGFQLSLANGKPAGDPQGSHSYSPGPSQMGYGVAPSVC